MKIVNIEDHDFGAPDWEHNTRGNLYICSVCGCHGFSKDGSQVIVTEEEYKKKAQKCEYFLHKTSIGIKGYEEITLKSISVVKENLKDWRNYYGLRLDFLNGKSLQIDIKVMNVTIF